MPLIREPEPENYEPEVFLGISAIKPLPASIRMVLTVVLMFGLITSGIGVGVLVALYRTQQTQHELEVRRAERDAERDAVTEKLRLQAKSIADNQEQERAAVCTALTAPTAKQMSPPVVQLIKDFRCVTVRP